jgi:hypothetical protein
MNWLVRKDPDNHNKGPVVYLRGVDFDQHETYSNFVRIQEKRIRISLDQALFWPLMACFIDARHHPNAGDHETRLAHSYELLIHGDHPPQPNQLTIDGKPVVGDLTNFLTVSPDFKLHVPAPSYDSTLGQNLDVPLDNEGDWDCVVSGYFVLLKPIRVGNYTIASNATAEEGYHTETLAEIQVFDESREKRAKFYSEVMEENIVDALKKQGAEISNLNRGLADDPNLAKYLSSMKKILDKGHRQSE